MQTEVGRASDGRDALRKSGWRVGIQAEIITSVGRMAWLFSAELDV